MNFKQAMWKLEKGKKITRPCWEEGSYWYVDEDSEIILWTDGTPAKIHLKQIQAEDWEVYKSNEKVEVVCVYGKFEKGKDFVLEPACSCDCCKEESFWIQVVEK